MAEPIPIRSAMLMSISGLAVGLGSSRETVRKRLMAAGVKPAGEHRGNPVYLLRDALAAWMDGQRAEFDPDQLGPFERKAYYQGEREKLQMQVERGDLVPRIMMERDMARAFQLAAQAFDTLPDVLERDCGLPAHALQRVESHLDRVREELYAELIRDDPAGDEADAEG